MSALTHCIENESHVASCTSRVASRTCRVAEAGGLDQETVWLGNPDELRDRGAEGAGERAAKACIKPSSCVTSAHRGGTLWVKSADSGNSHPPASSRTMTEPE